LIHFFKRINATKVIMNNPCYSTQQQQFLDREIGKYLSTNAQNVTWPNGEINIVTLPFLNTVRMPDEDFQIYAEEFDLKCEELDNLGARYPSRFLALNLLKNANLSEAEFDMICSNLNISSSDENTTDDENIFKDTKDSLVRLSVSNLSSVSKPMKDKALIEVDENRRNSCLSLVTLPNETLLIILKYLSHSDLLSVSETCIRLNQFCLQVRSLWTEVDFSGHPMEWKSMTKIMNCLHNRTKSLTLEGFLSPQTPFRLAKYNVTGPLLAGIAINCENLTVLKLRNVKMPLRKVKIQHFPGSLTHLSLIGCDFDGGSFEGISTSLPKLEFLSLERSKAIGWVSDGIDIGKLEHLKEFSLRGCKLQMLHHPQMLQPGFPRLEVLDIRDTGKFTGHQTTRCDLGFFAFGNYPLKELYISHLREHFHLNFWGHLRFTWQHFFRNTGFEECIGISTLEKLVLEKCRIKDRDLDYLLNKYSNLKYVHFKECSGFSDAKMINFEMMMKSRNDSSQVIFS